MYVLPEKNPFEIIESEFLLHAENTYTCESFRLVNIEVSSIADTLSSIILNIDVPIANTCEKSYR